MYHVIVMILTLAGQPVGLAEAPEPNAFADMAACEAVKIEQMSATQAVLDGSKDTADKYIVVAGKCLSDAEIEAITHAHERGALNKSIGEERVD